MSTRSGLYTFDSLAEANEEELGRITGEGRAPEIEDLLGYEFRGWNLSLLSLSLSVSLFPGVVPLYDTVGLFTSDAAYFGR